MFTTEEAFERELDRLLQAAKEAVVEFQAQRKPLGGVLPLWVKARRRGHTLQIEWEDCTGHRSDRRRSRGA